MGFMQLLWLFHGQARAGPTDYRGHPELWGRRPALSMRPRPLPAVHPSFPTRLSPAAAGPRLRHFTYCPEKASSHSSAGPAFLNPPLTQSSLGAPCARIGLSGWKEGRDGAVTRSGLLKEDRH